MAFATGVGLSQSGPEFYFTQIGTAGQINAENQGNIRFGTSSYVPFQPNPILTRSMRIQMSAANGTVGVTIFYTF